MKNQAETTYSGSGRDGHEQEFNLLISQIESSLAEYYEFSLAEKATDFTVGHENFVLLAEREPGSRAEVCLVQDGEEDAFLGIYFSDEIRESLAINPPQQELSRKNLDAFCVVVEELSHFHLIFQRCLQSRQVSHMELEWQAEIDKVLLSSIYLQEQAGSWHLEPLTRLIFDHATVANNSPYKVAHRYAARFWQLALASGVGEAIPVTDQRFKGLMQTNYRRPLHEKSPFSPGETSWLAKKNSSS